jgi:hypothetical protein
VIGALLLVVMAAMIVAWSGIRAARSQIAAAQAARALAAAQATRVAAARAAVVAPAVPSRVTIVQRKSQPLPGTNGSIVARIGDITGGQVLLTIDDAGGQPLVNTLPMREGDSTQFTVGAAKFEIELVELKNFLTGDDFAVFALRQAGTALSEEEKIKRLIDAVAREPGMSFIRNGQPYTGEEAAAHLNRKYQAAGDKWLTAREFIEDLASRSSVSGQEHRVKLPDGTEQSASHWLSARLSKIELAKASTRATGKD